MADRKRSIRLDWDNLRVLIELARHGSLSATARAMKVTHATISRRLATLEADLSQPLFVREAGRYVLTEAGKRVLVAAQPMAESADAVARIANGLEARLGGPVRITTTEAVATYVVMPGIKAIRRRYPAIDITLNVSQQLLSLARSDADIAVRLFRPDPGTDLLGHKIGELDYHLYGARSYVDGRKRELLEYIGSPDEFAGWPEYKVFDELALGGRTALRINHLGNRIAACREGLGIAMLPSLMAEPWPELVRVSTSPVMFRDVYVVVHAGMQGVPRIKAALDVLTETIGTRSPHRA
jgi:DNA-binding transcriptional LysR family regulator